MKCLWLCPRTCVSHLLLYLLCRLCLSITDFHPDTWNPAWSVSTILTGLLSFMVEKGPTLGSIETSDYTVSTTNDHKQNAKFQMPSDVSSTWGMFYFLSFQKRQLSAQSLAFNLKDKVFCELFPDVVDVRMRRSLNSSSLLLLLFA